LLAFDALEKFTRKVSITVDLDKIKPDLIEAVIKGIKSSSGNSELDFRVRDAEGNMSVSMHPNKAKVNPVSFMKKMEDIPDVELFLKQ